jgi:mRNA-degrading endonuclease RelE of RelBE toxin-antitoxin system
MNIFVFSNFAEKSFLKFELQIRNRIVKKLIELKFHNNLFNVLTSLKGFKSDLYRLRIGNYLSLKSKTKNQVVFIVLDIGHRKNIFK